ncbi:MAG: hypothetical protein ABTB30_13625, partial [Clostridia bacterium]
NLMKMFDYSEEYVPFGAHYLAGSVSSDLLMPALFTGETGGDFYRLVYGSRTALEIGLYDGQWYALKDAEGKLYLVQVYLDPNDPNRIQVPVAFNLDKKYGVTTSGLLQFVFEGEKETPALGLVLKKIPLDYGEGCEPLNQELFTGSVFQTRGFLKPGTVDINLSPELRLDGTESGGFTLVRVPFSEVELIKDAKAEYYLRDIYGNELVLTEAFAAAENEPLLKNLAFAEAKVDDGTVTVTCGGKTLDADLDYMVYTKDGETLIQGIGEYAGSIVLDNAE